MTQEFRENRFYFYIKEEIRQDILGCKRHRAVRNAKLSSNPNAHPFDKKEWSATMHGIFYTDWELRNIKDNFLEMLERMSEEIINDLKKGDEEYNYLLFQEKNKEDYSEYLRLKDKFEKYEKEI